jgi:hypothetical protein
MSSSCTESFSEYHHRYDDRPYAPFHLNAAMFYVAINRLVLR